jgi:predicted ABC-type ATPase
MGGLGGAGKSTVLKKIPGLSLSDYAVVNADDFKHELAARGLVPEVSGLSPLEAAPLVHDESSYLADEAARLLRERGKNIAYDMTMGHQAPVVRRLDALSQAGYSTRAVFVDSPVERSVRRAQSRHRQGLEAYRAGTDPLGGRYVPPDLIRSQEAEPGVTRNRQNFEQLKSRFGHWQLWDNSGTKPKLEQQSRTAPDEGIPSVEALLKQQKYTGNTEAQARAAEKGTAAEEET